jgi:REP element-mobilizing transposase RayT
MNRGTNRNPIFLQDGDRDIFLKTLGESVALWKIRVHAFSLMNNHYHLLLETPLGNLSRAMRHIDGVYTQRLNRKWGRDGPLMRGRFKSILIEQEHYFLEVIRYIHLNGVRALLYSKPALDPHCSHPVYVEKKVRPTWLSTDLALSYFGGRGMRRETEFDRFIEGGVSKKIQDILDGKRWPAFLGGEEFVDGLRQRFGVEGQKASDQPQKRELQQIISWEEIIRKVCLIYQINPAHLGNRNRKDMKPARRTAIFFLRHKGHLTYKEIGELMGGITRGPIARICQDAELERGPEFRLLEQDLGQLDHKKVKGET